MAILACLPAQADPTPVEIADLHRIVDLAEPIFTPDGQRVVFSASTHNLESDVTVSDLWSAAWNGGAPTAITSTPDISEWAPRFSQDGKRLAFLSDGAADDTVQVWVMAFPGGVPRQATHLPGGVQEYDITPDGQHIIAIAEAGLRVGLDAERTAPPIVIDRFQFKEDGRSYLDDRRRHIFSVDIETGLAKQITTGDFDHWFPRVSPDGKSLAFVSKRRGDADRNIDFDVFVMSLEPGAGARQVSNYTGADSEPVWESPPEWSPDGSKLVWVRTGADKWIYYSPVQLAVADLNTGKVTEPAHIDRWFTRPRFSADGKSILALVEQDRDTWLAKIDLATERVDYLTNGARFAYDFAISPRGQVAVLDGEAARPYVIRALDQTPRILADFNGWLDERTLAAYRDVSWRSDGQTIHGLLALPLGHTDGQKHPLIVRLHGGPVYQFSHEFMFDMQLYAAQGYAVLAVNPRGSSGRGFDFARAIYADWGNRDVKDVSAGIDHLIRLGLADADRIGVGGWSYGGILTNYMIASDKRIKAAVSGAGMSNFLGGYGADQYGREYELELGKPWEHPDLWKKLSYPFFQSARIKAATLFMCAAADVNVPCIGAEQMYQALRSRDVPAQLVIYPDETHSLTVPSYLKDRLQRHLDWYGRFLKAAPD